MRFLAGSENFRGSNSLVSATRADGKAALGIRHVNAVPDQSLRG